MGIISNTVSDLHEHGIIHTDLNSRNIMLLSAKSHMHQCYGQDNLFQEKAILVSAKIRIIDFGSIGGGVTQFGDIIGSAGYRAPEILLELDTSSPLLPPPEIQMDDAAEDGHYLALMEHVTGPLTTEMKNIVRIHWPGLLSDDNDHLDDHQSTQIPNRLANILTLKVNSITANSSRH
ncbi:hypothetical protein B0H11DRAFT_1912941 [Mycena galericulata]|nr:hypothetical protein B0H11DRAFT_1912941 [Mycena galericulata]